ncbi:MAG: hypothetical protein DME19_11140 [Verrucomicrobia bacterium]|nr:MAG: hypothetical protein DME19_11140 [Verrucomicrobiota bacterium]
MNEDRKAQEWLELKKLEKDFFQELQFLSARVRTLKLERMESGVLGVILTLPILLLILLLAFMDFSR